MVCSCFNTLCAKCCESTLVGHVTPKLLAFPPLPTFSCHTLERWCTHKAVHTQGGLWPTQESCYLRGVRGPASRPAESTAVLFIAFLAKHNTLPG